MSTTLIISGGSITHGGWPTWKDFVINRYGISDFYNLAKVGLGNEAIINRAIAQASQVKNPVIIAMLTNVDKWDWYVDDQELISTLNNEKHTISPIHNNDNGGYWSTGSHFPLYKETYKEKYYNETYQTLHTISSIILLQSYCTSNDIPLLLLFDSPIFKCFEAELNENPSVLPDHKLSAIPAVEPFYKLIDKKVSEDGLIGFCFKHNLPWYHVKYKGHPGSLAHYRFAEECVFPQTDKIFKAYNKDQINYAIKMNKLWLETNQL